MQILSKAVLTIAGLLADNVSSRVIKASYRVFERLSAAPSGWSMQAHQLVDPSTPLSLRMHLKQQNVAEFEQLVYDISTPGHPSYGAHMSQLEIKDMLRPRDETTNLVMSWLDSANLRQKSRFEHDWVYIEATIAEIEDLLDAEYAYFQNEETQTTVLRTLSFALPVQLHDHVNMIHPTTHFPGKSSMKTSVEVVKKRNDKREEAHRQQHEEYERSLLDGLDVARCNATVTPDCLKALYGFEHYKPNKKNGNKFAVAGYLKE